MSIEEKKIKPIHAYGISFILLFFIFLLTQIFQLIYVQTGIFPKANLKELTSFHILLGTVTTALVAVGLSIFVIKKTGIKIFDFQNKFNFWEMLVGLIGLIVIYSIINLVMGFFNVQVDPFEKLPKENLKSSPFNFILSVVIIAPIYEEFIYRGVLLGSIINSYEEPTEFQTVMALTFSALFFSIMHFSIDNFIPIFVIGLYLGALSIYKKNFFLPIVVHLFNNLYICISFFWA